MVAPYQRATYGRRGLLVVYLGELAHPQSVRRAHAAAVGGREAVERRHARRIITD